MTETIVMIHGMWVGGWCWENFKSFFEERGYRCRTPTLRLHDVNPKASPDPRLGTTGLLDYVEDIENEFSKLDTQPIVMGHSMGGLLAQILGSRVQPKALVLLAPAPPSGIIAMKPSMIRSFWSGITTWGFWRKPIRQTFDEAAYSTLNLVPVAERKEIFSRFVYESGRAVWEIGFWFLDRKNAARGDEAKVSCPALIVAGGQDRITPASVARKVADKYRGVSTYKEFSNHAHWLVGEPGWQEIAEYVHGWLGQLPTGGSRQ